MRKNKKWALFLVTIIIMSLVPMAVAGESEEIVIQNAGFEEASEMENPCWVYMKGAEITVDKSRKHTGENSLKINNTQGNNPWAKQDLTGFTSGAMYEVGAWLNTDLADPDGRGVGFKIEQYYADGNPIVGRDFSGEMLRINTLGQWNYHSIFFQAAQDVHKVTLYLRSYTPGVAWYDDVSVKLSGGPEPYGFYADHVFHYPDEETGAAYIELDPYYGESTPECTDVSASFSLSDGENVLDKIENIKIYNGTAKYTYAVSLMSEKQKKYTLTAELFDKKGARIREWKQNMYIYDRPLWFSDGRWVYDGERFDPVIAYHVNPDHINTLPKGTFNVFQVGFGYNLPQNDTERESYLSTLDAAGKKALICLYTDMKAAGHPDNAENTKRIVEMYKDDPRIFAWAVQDEPLGAGVEWEKRKQYLEDSYRIIRDIDPNHPVYLLDYNHHRETIKYCDLFVADAYAHGKSALGVSKIVEPLAKNYNRIPTYELAACYKQNGVFPPMTTARASVYRGFAAGNSYGTGFYAISDAIGHDGGDQLASLETLDVWQEYVTLLSEECPVLFDYYAGYEGEDYISFNKYREGALYAEQLWETWFNKDGDMYLLAHNRSEQAVGFNIPLVSVNGKIRVGAFSATPIGLTKTGEKSGKGEISFTLGQEEIALYKITPSEKVDLTHINAPTFDDLDGDYAWAKEAVVKTQALGIINSKGEATFAPGEAITRGDFAGFLIRTLGFASDSTENFADVPAEREYAKEIAVGKALDILNGVGENMFSPEAAITRQDMMTICARGMKMAEKLATADTSVLDAFHDKANVADYALESVSAMIQSGIIKGDDAGWLNPTGNTRRAEAAVIMGRILNAEKVLTTPDGSTEALKTENEVIPFDAPEESALKRYTRAAELLKGLSTAEIKVEDSITNGEAEAAVSKAAGFAFDAFGENHKALTTAKAVEELVKLLDYEAYAQRDGGFMGVAARIDLIRGVDISSEYMRGGEFAVMLENALGIYLCDRVAFGDGADEEYAESDDTLLTRYRHFTLHKGILEQNENTGLAKGYVSVGTFLLKTGNTDAKSFIGQRVEAYTEGEDNTIVFIRAHKSVIATRISAENINAAETTVSNLVYEDGNGHTKSISINGAKLIYNGKYKDNYTEETLMPKLGTVTVIENGGINPIYVFVEEYKNYIVDSIRESTDTIYFKNRDALVWEENSSSKKHTLEGASFKSLKEWMVLSIYENGDIVRAVASDANVKGTIKEISKDEIKIGETSFKLGEGCFGKAVLGETCTFLLDAEGLVAGVNDKSVTPNYAYLISIAEKKGVDAAVQMRVFTKEGEMKVLDVKDTVVFNGEPTKSAELLKSSILFSGKDFIDQLIVMETVGNAVTSFKTADNGAVMTENERLSAFTWDLKTENNASKIRYDGHAARVIASKYIVHEDIVFFVVPEKTSSNDADYSIRTFASFVHGNKYPNATLYDVDADMNIGAMVQKIANISDVGTGGTSAVITKFGTALDEITGETVKTVTVLNKEEKTLRFQSEDFKIVLGAKALTDIAKGETEYTIVDGTKTVKDTILPASLQVGDVVSYVLKEGTTDVISGMRVLLRAKSPQVNEMCQEGMGEWYNYSLLTYAYGRVNRVVERGVLLTPDEYERLYLFEGHNGDAPVILVENGTAKLTSPREIVKDDMVYVQKQTVYQILMVVYR